MLSSLSLEIDSSLRADQMMKKFKFLFPCSIEQAFTHTHTEREREKERDRDKDRQADRQKETDRDREATIDAYIDTKLLQLLCMLLF